MELTQQVATLDDELKLLKGEIKVILKEIRAAVLSNNNPFTMDVSAMDAPAPAAPAPSLPDEPAAKEEEAPPKPALPELPLAGPAGPTTPPAGPTTPPLDGPMAGPTGPPVGLAGPPPAPQEETNASKGQRWSFLTIAGLMAWAEDAVATVGSDRFRTILELATLAELLPEEMRDALDRFAKLAPAGGRDHDKPINVIECVVVLHQLEAILQGETPTRLPLRRDTAWLGPMQAATG